jgi:lipopolysaccharide export system protein LptA
MTTGSAFLLNDLDRSTRGARRTRWTRLVVTGALLCAVGPLAAEKADRNKPLNIEADRMQYDDLKQINVFTGKVTLTKGTMIIRGDRVVVRQDAAGYQFGDANGKPAFFRQKRDGGDQFIEGRADRVEYDGKQDTLRLSANASLKRLEKERIVDEIYGNSIFYDAKTEVFTVEGGAAHGKSAESNGRVKVIIQPRSTTNAGEAPAADEPAPLKSAPPANPSDSRRP